MKLRRFLSAVTALLLVCGMPVSVFAAEYDLAEGSVTVTATESGQTVTHGDNAAVQDKDPVIIQTNNETSTTNTITIKAEGSATANVTIQDVNIVISNSEGGTNHYIDQAAVSINVADNASANVTLDGVKIDTQNTGGEFITIGGDSVKSSGYAAVQITGSGDVTLELDGENTVQSGSGRAGVEKNSGGSLTITDENETHGSLIATGGEAGSGIGGGKNGSGSNITITGNAEVTAQGGQYGAGIGGGDWGSGSDITITGNAEVTAQGGQYGAGIGGSGSKSGSNITISGSAEVTAQGGVSGSGIGGGYRSTGSENITVSGDAQVKAQGGNGDHWGYSSHSGAGAAIGDGGKYSGSSPDNIAGEEKTPSTDALNEGWIATYAPGITDLDTTTPDSLTYKDASGTVQTATQNITLLPAQSATDDTHEQKAGFKVGDVEVAVKTHRYGNYQPDDNATCTHDGTKTAMCTVPGCTATHTIPNPGSMLVEHEFGEYVPDANNLATCTKAGTKTAKCKHCTATDTVPDPIKDHSMGEYYTDTPATCKAEGVEQRDCENCNYYETRPLKKVDHSYGDYTSDDNATCTADGTKTRKCIWCDLPDTIPDPGTMLEHSFTNYIYDNNATYEADGTGTAKCAHCDATDTIPAPGTRLPFYKVKGQDGAGLPCEEERQDGVLTITVDADCASLTGTFGGIKALKAQGVDTIVFVTKGAASTFAIEDLLAQGASGDTYSLTHDGSTVTFTLGNGTDMSKILK